MTQLNIPYNFQNQTTSDANQVDQNFSAVANVVNGKLADDNMTPNSLTSASVATEGIIATDTKNLVYAQDLFSSSFIISGGVCTKDGTNANQVDVTSPILGWVKQSDNTFRRLSVVVTNYKTTIASTTYYLDLGADGIVYWAQSHPSVNYATIATVTSDASGNVNVITDTRSFSNTSLSNYLRTDANAPNPQTVTNPVTFNNGLTFNGGSFGVRQWSQDNNWGAYLKGGSGSLADVALVSNDGTKVFKISTSGMNFSGDATFAGNVTAPNISSPASGSWTPAGGTFNVAVGTVINVASAPTGAKMFFATNRGGVSTDVIDSWGITTSSGSVWKCNSQVTSQVVTGRASAISSTSVTGTVVNIGDSSNLYKATGYFQINGGYFQFVVVSVSNTSYASTIDWAVS